VRQFDISDSALTEMLAIMEWYGRLKAERIESAYLSLRHDLPRFPELGGLEGDGRTRVLHRAELYWVYEVLDDCVRVLGVLDPTQNLPR